jgi:glycine/serine hydroxymethyltransferase
MRNTIPKELAPLFSPELTRHYKYLSLSANENVISNTAAEFLGSEFANRYYFKTNSGEFQNFPDFVASGSQAVDHVVDAAKKAVCDMTGATYVNLSALSGIHAMLMTIVSLTEPGDIVISLSPAEGGHFSTQSIVEGVGRKSGLLPLSHGQPDTQKLKKLLASRPVKLIYLDLMSHIESVDIAAIRDAVGKDMPIVYDASHTLGLILGGRFQDPFKEGADVICANTHKTFPGPHRGIIIAKEKSVGQKIESTLDGTFYSSVHYGSLMAMLVTIFEMQDYGQAFAEKIVHNAQALAHYLELYGAKVAPCADGTLTKNHQVHLTFKNRDAAFNGLENLRKNDIVAHLCYRADTGHFVRFGTQELTRRGMNQDDMELVTRIVLSALNKKNVRRAVAEITDQNKQIYFSFDDIINRGHKE